MSDSQNDAYIIFSDPGRIEGGGTVEILGESYDSDEETWYGYASEINSVTFGVETEGKTGNTASTDKVKCKEVQIQKFTDWATAKYIVGMVEAAEFPKATILLRANYKEYLRIELERVTIKSVNFQQTGADQATDTIQLEYKEFFFRYAGVKPPEDLRPDENTFSEARYDKTLNKGDNVGR